MVLISDTGKGVGCWSRLSKSFASGPGGGAGSSFGVMATAGEGLDGGRRGVVKALASCDLRESAMGRAE